MKPTELLTKEHDTIKIMLQVVEKVCAKLESGDQVSQEHLKQIVDFIRGFADKHHHGKEENWLFTEMIKAGIPKEGGPIGCMLEEHEIGRRCVRGMNETLEAIDADAQNATANFIKNAREYVALLTDHIYKENNILYPMADANLSEEQQQKLQSQFEVIQNEHESSGKQKEFREILDGLKGAYLNC